MSLAKPKPGDPFTFLEIKTMRVAEATNAYVKVLVTHIPVCEVDTLIEWLQSVKKGPK